MKQRSTSEIPWPVFAVTVAAAFMVALVLVDFITPANFILPIFYCVPLVLHIWVRNLRLLWRMALLIIGLTFACFFLRMGSAVPEVEHAALLNRAASALVTLLLAGLIHQRIVSERAAPKGGWTSRLQSPNSSQRLTSPRSSVRRRPRAEPN